MDTSNTSKYTTHDHMSGTQAPDMLAEQLALAKQGIRTFTLHSVVDERCTCGDARCPSPGKHPRTSNGFYAATTEPLIIRNQRRGCPDANIGARTGKVIVVLDADDGDEGLQEASSYGADPHGLHVVTGNGRHFYFAAPAGVVLRNKAKNTENWPFAHCDARGEGGYVVAPPSLHASGRRYAFSAPFARRRRWDALASQKNSPGSRSISPPTRPATPPANSSSWMAASRRSNLPANNEPNNERRPLTGAPHHGGYA